MPSTINVSNNVSSSLGGQNVTKKKGAGYLRHTTQSMRRIARLPAKDREEVLCSLKRNVSKRKRQQGVSKCVVNSKDIVEKPSASQSSVNNDWNSWLVLHGTEQEANEDVLGIGKDIGLKFTGDRNNSFDVLSSEAQK